MIELALALLIDSQILKTVCCISNNHHLIYVTFVRYQQSKSNHHSFRASCLFVASELLIHPLSKTMHDCQQFGSENQFDRPIW